MTSVRIFRMNPKRDDERVTVHKYTKDEVNKSISVLKDFCCRYDCANDHEKANEKENAEVMETIRDPNFLQNQTESLNVINKDLIKCGLAHVG